MTQRIEKTVFISYRRTNFWTALAVFQNLNSNGYDVFLDYKSIPSGNFEQVIIENVKSRAHFIVILSPSALERCHEPDDWLRREIELAIENKRNIIPLIMEGFEFGSAATKNALTGKLRDLKKYNAMGIPIEYFEEAMLKLRSDRFLNRPLESVLHPVSEVTQQYIDEQKSAAKEASLVEKEQLTAQEWFEKGFIFQQKNNIDEAIRCYSEAIKLENNFDSAYCNRGYLFIKKGNLDGAIRDYAAAYLLTSDKEIRKNSQQQLVSTGVAAVAPLIEELIQTLHTLKSASWSKSEQLDFVDALSDHLGPYAEQMRQEINTKSDGGGMSIAQAIYSREACRYTWQVVSQIGEPGIRALFALINGREIRMRLAAILVLNNEENPSGFVLRSLMTSVPYRETYTNEIEYVAALLTTRLMAVYGNERSKKVLEELGNKMKMDGNEFTETLIDHGIILLAE